MPKKFRKRASIKRPRLIPRKRRKAGKPRKRGVGKRRRLVLGKRRKAKKPRPRAPQPKPYDARLEEGLKQLRQGKSLAEAARLVGVTDNKLRNYVLATGIVTRKRGKWLFKRDRRFRRMPLYSAGQRVVVTVRNGKTSSLIGSYMGAVGQFLLTEDIGLLKPFHDQSVPDVHGKRYVFETRPNYLYRLDSPGLDSFELYAIVKRE